MTLALSEAWRVLRPGGVLVVYSPSRYNRHERIADPTHINMLTPAELKTAVTAARFHRVEPIDDPRLLLGSGRVGRGVMRAVTRTYPWAPLIATANCIARKPLPQ
jgi:SAM-dependent methyltransferase